MDERANISDDLLERLLADTRLLAAADRELSRISAAYDWYREHESNWAARDFAVAVSRILNLGPKVTLPPKELESK